MPQGVFGSIWTKRAAAMCAVFALAGCVGKSSQVAPAVVSEAPAKASALASPDYEAAVSAHFRGDYRRAAELFESLVRQSSDPVLSRRAAYGLACSLLAQAETREDFKFALSKWRDWEAMSSRGDAAEDPRMLAPVLQNLRPCDNREPAKPAKSDGDCARRLEEKEKEVRLLNNQIKALEKIHREIQERKKELSSP